MPRFKPDDLTSLWKHYPIITYTGSPSNVLRRAYLKDKFNSTFYPSVSLGKQSRQGVFILQAFRTLEHIENYKTAYLYKYTHVPTQNTNIDIFTIVRTLSEVGFMDRGEKLRDIN